MANRRLAAKKLQLPLRADLTARKILTWTKSGILQGDAGL